MELFGRLPVRLRQFIRHHIIALPGPALRPPAVRATNIQMMNGDCEITVFIHERGHSLDSHAFDPKHGVTRYGKDTAVADDYGQTFAAGTLCAGDGRLPSTTRMSRAALARFGPNAQAIRNAYTTLEKYIGDIIIPGGECTHRLENSPAVPKAASARTRLVAKSEPVGEGLMRIEPIPVGRITPARY
ncbi:hypothetical protein MY11210_002094 [Beauveria gryllotalpidicola]